MRGLGACLVGLVCAFGTAAALSAQGDDASLVTHEVTQLLATAQEQIAARDFAAAGATLDSAMMLGPVQQREVSLLLYLRGTVFYELGQPDRAIFVWNEALEIGGLPEAQRKALENALARLSEQGAPAETPDSPQELLQAAEQATRFGRVDEAGAYYEAAIEGFAADGHSAGLARAHFGFGYHLATAKRDFDGAFDQYALALEHAESSGDALLLRSALGAFGGAAIMTDRAEDGRTAFARVLTLLGDEETAPRAAALSGVAEASLRLKDWPAAADAYEQLLAVDPSRGPGGTERTLHSYALSLHLAGRIDDALAAIGRLDALAQSDDARRRLALQLEQTGARARALENVATGCWFDGRARERYLELGRQEDADVLQAVLEAEGCAEAAID